MKIAIVSIADLRHMSMVSLYTQYFQKYDIEYDIICSNRYSSEKVDYLETPSNEYGKVYKFPWIQSKNTSKYKKIIPLLKFRRFSKRIIKNKNYDFICVWNENTMMVIGDILLSMQNKYCVNIRDFDYPKMLILNQLRNLIFKKAAFNTRVYIDKTFDCDKYNTIPIVSRNLDIIKKCKYHDCLVDKTKPIRITYIGNIRNIEEDKKIIKAFGNDDRFVIQFFGTGAEELEDFVLKNKYKNVVLKGIFNVEETAKYLDQSDVIHAYYGKKIYGWSIYAPIKSGYATSLGIPLLVTPDTYLDRIVKKYGIGYTIDSFEDLATHFYNWYYSLDIKMFLQGCQEYERFVDGIQEVFYETCDRYFRNE